MSPAYRYEIGYGKKRVPVYRTHARPLTGVTPIPESPFVGRGNELLAAEIDVDVYGDDFLPAYTRGDNSMVVATDSMKNFVIRETLAFDGATLEGLCRFLADRFAETYPQLRSLRVSGRELPFAGVPVPHGPGFAPSDNLYERRPGDFGEATVRIDISDDGVHIADHACYRRDLQFMKLTGSAFTAFVRDGYTTLPERGDRPLYIFMDVGWRYAEPAAGFCDDPAHFVPSEQVRDLCATVFAEFVSESIQQLVHEMGRRLLDRFPHLAEVTFVATNRTRDPFGARDDGSEAKVYSDPFSAFGEITLRMSRGGTRARTPDHPRPRYRPRSTRRRDGGRVVADDRHRRLGVGEAGANERRRPARRPAAGRRRVRRRPLRVGVRDGRLLGSPRRRSAGPAVPRQGPDPILYRRPDNALPRTAPLLALGILDLSRELRSSFSRPSDESTLLSRARERGWG